jgi:hypothetical protein
MVDWRSSGRIDGFRYMRVDRHTHQDTVELGNILDGGTISRNSLTALKSSASVGYQGDMDIGNDYLRIYSESSLGGETATVAHGTYIVSTPESEVGERLATGTASLYSLLLLLQRRRLGLPLSIPAGTVAVTRAKEMAQEVGLRVLASMSTAALTSDKAYDSNMTWLEVVNDLLEFAGFRSVTVDGMGNARMDAIRDLSAVAPSVEFRSGAGSVHAPIVRRTLDAFDVPNRLTVVCSRPDQPPIAATAVNDDPSNRYSTVSVGAVIDAETETVDDIANMDTLMALARHKLIMKTSAVESHLLTHSYVPLEMDDGVLVEHGGSTFVGVAVSSDMRLTPGMVCETRIRDFVRF